jgi:hypothetical protein
VSGRVRNWMTRPRGSESLQTAAMKHTSGTLSLVALSLAFSCSSGGDQGPSGSPGGASGTTGGGGNGPGGASTTNSGTGAVNGSPPGGGSSSVGGGASGTGGSSASAGGSAGNAAGGSAGTPPPGTCAVTADRVRITEIDVGAKVVSNEDEAALKPLAISPIPSGGSRVAWMGDDGKVHVTSLDAADQITGVPVALPATDFGDVYADDGGGVLLVTRDAKGGGTLNCGEPTNLCGTPPNPPIPCYDMYMVRFDGAAETWATELTQASAALPPYSTGKTGANVVMIWWYAHHGRIVSDGTNFAGYFGAAISVSQGGCINIHQGDRMKIVSPSGALQSGGFDWGCSHSGYERIVWDGAANKYVTVCKNDAPTGGKSGRIAFAPKTTTILPQDLFYGNVGNIVLAKGGGYWLTESDIRAGQPAGADGLADVHLLHFTTGAPDKDVVLATDPALNDRAPHLSAYGADGLLAAWETSTATGDLKPRDTNRKFYVQSLDAATGATIGAPLQVSVSGNRYYEFKSYRDGSVAYAAPGSAPTKIKILRILPCGA